MSTVAKITGNQVVDVNERRLRPIYDSLDAGDNKKALQEADRILKKQKDLLCAKALKTLALIRLNRIDEAIVILEEVRLSKPVDDVTLQATSMCFRELQRLDYMVEMYENASRLKTDNEDILTHLFMSYVRINNFKKQQQTAMLLHKLRPLKNPYYFWSVMSVYMQANDNKELASKMLLPLAEKMILKFINEDRIEAEAEVQLYLLVLKSMGKFSECLNVMKGPLAEKFSSDKFYLDNLELDLLEKTGSWRAVNDKCKSLIANQPEQWLYYCKYMQSFFQLKHNEILINGSSDNNSVTNNEINGENIDVEEVLVFFHEILSSLKKRRISFLVKLEFISRLSANGFKNWDRVFEGETLLGIMKDFCEIFGDKTVCFKDIQTHLKLLPLSQQQELAVYLQKDFTELDESHPVLADLRILQRHQLFLQVSHYLGFHGDLNVDDQIKLVSFVYRCYNDGLKFGEGFLSTDIQPADFYALLSSTLLYNLATQTGERRYLMTAVYILEMSRSKSPSNFKIKFCLIHLYAKLGSFGTCLEVYESLDIKHIQYDTLGYSILKYASSFGHYKFCDSFIQSVLSFHNNTYKEISEYIIAAYKYGTFIKIEEFVSFRERLRGSYVYPLVILNKLLNDLMTATSEKEMCDTVQSSLLHERCDVTNVATSSLIDNRDFKIVPTWLSPKFRVDENLIKASFERELITMEIRLSILQCLLTMLRSPNKKSLANGAQLEEKRESNLELELRQLKGAFEKAFAFSDTVCLCLYVPMRNDFYIYTSLNLHKFLCLCFEYFQNVSSYSDEICESNYELKDEDYNVEALEKIESNLNNLPILFEMLSVIVEHVCLVAIILHCSHSILRPLKPSGSGKKNKRKGEDSPAKTKLSEKYTRLHSSVVELAEGILSKLNAFHNSSIYDLMQDLVLDPKLLQIELDDRVVNKNRSETEASLNQTVTNFRTRLNLRLAFLKSIKL